MTKQDVQEHNEAEFPAEAEKSEPTKITENVTRLDYQGKEIILVATAHVSKQSVELVKEVIATEQPDSVCVELDAERYKNIQDPQAWQNTDIVEVIKSKKVSLMFVNLVLSAYQKRIAEQLNTTVGQEMLQGIRSAEEQGAALVLADRKIQITFLRIWRKLSLWEKNKFVFGLLFTFTDEEDITEEDLQTMLQEDMLESIMVDMRKEFPKIGAVLIDERDQYLACKIREAPGPKVVAVLGGAHVPGVKAEIYRDQDMEEISTIPKRSPVFKIIGWIIPIAILGLILYAFADNFQTGFQQIKTWVIWNSSLAALGTALALGHPLSILTAFVAAPFTSLNPFLACGWFAGLVEATVRKPLVKDVQNIITDITSFRGFFQNRFLRILLVVILANLGGSIGTFVAGFDILKNLNLF